MSQSPTRRGALAGRPSPGALRKSAPWVGGALALALAAGLALTVGPGDFGLGDVLKARGDLFGAVNAWERVIAGAAPGDSLAEDARARLNAIGDAGTVRQ